MKRPHPKDPPGFLLRRSVGKASKPRPKVSQPEAATLADVCAHCDARGVEWFHMPEWLLGLAFAVEKGNADPVMREAAADVRGLPDLLLFYRGRFMSIELKVPGEDPRKSQRTWAFRLGALCCRTTAEACAAIDEWIQICEP